MRKDRYRRRLFDPVAVPKICCSLFAHQILTAATPFCSLHLPQAALANVPTSIRLRICLC